MPYTTRTTRTVRTIISDGRGPAKVQTRTFTYGGDGPSDDYNGDDGGFSIGSGGGRYNFQIGGGGDRGYTSSVSLPAFSQRPQVGGRSSRRERKNPFAGIINQNYEEIKQKCQEEDCLFEDPEFEAENSSIFFSKESPRRFEWKRPHEICDSPVFISDGASRFDVQQGELGDCWLLAAVASLTVNSKLFARVVPADQTFGDGYCGVFKFHFWRQGEWVEVVVDDRLPTYYGQLVFMHSTDKNEFWSALLEKAYAKLEGSYESLKGGSTCEAMVDFTGGVSEMYDLKKAPTNLFTILLKANQRGSLMGCSIDADPNQLEARLANGLVMGHAYSITNVTLMDINTPAMSGKIPMVRVRNPWGNEAEWKGAFSDGSREWTMIPTDQREQLGLTFDDDGEFWMSFNDWKSNFEKVEICNLGPDSLEEEDDDSGRKKWEGHTQDGEWIPGVNAGGCRNYLDTFWTNPQYRVTLTDPDDDDDDDLCTILVGVLQKDRRKKRKEGLDMLTIGYCIYKLNDPSTGPLDVNFFKYNASCAKSPSFINLREICGRHKLPAGTYCIIPSTFEPRIKGEYLLRIFTEKANETNEIDEETGIVEDQTLTMIGAYNVYEPGVYIENFMGQKIDPFNFGKIRPQSVAMVASAPNMSTPVQDTPKQPTAPRREIPPPTEEEQEQEEALKRSFRKVAGDDMEVDAFELKDILNAVFTREFSFDGFHIDTCRSMVAMHDGDLSGKLGYEEFKCLWNDLRRWKAVFKDYDKDRSGNLSSYELRSALHASGFRLSNRSFSALVMRYSNKSGQIEFGDFIVCTIRMKTMLASFKSAGDGQGGAHYDVDTFIQTVMYS